MIFASGLLRMESEQSGGIVLLLALATFIGSQIEVKPIVSEQEVCQRWFDYQGRGEDGRPSWNYEKECWYGHGLQ